MIQLLFPRAGNHHLKASVFNDLVGILDLQKVLLLHSLAQSLLVPFALTVQQLIVLLNVAQIIAINGMPARQNPDAVGCVFIGRAGIQLFLLRDKDNYPSGGTVPISVAPARRLDDGIQRRQRPEYHWKIQIHTGLDALGRHQAAGKSCLHSLPNLPEHCQPVSRTKVRSQEKCTLRPRLLHQLPVQGPGVGPQVDNGTSLIFLCHFPGNPHQGYRLLQPPIHGHPPCRRK